MRHHLIAALAVLGLGCGETQPPVTPIISAPLPPPAVQLSFRTAPVLGQAGEPLDTGRVALLDSTGTVGPDVLRARRAWGGVVLGQEQRWSARHGGYVGT